MSVIELNHVSYSVDSQPLVREVSLAVEAGDFVGLLGPNGSGKTTLVRLMTHVWKPTTGTIHIEGRDLKSVSVSELARLVAVVPQESLFSFPYSVEDVVAMGRYARIHDPFGMMTADDRCVITNAMEKTDCASLAKRSIQTLSGGEKQRVLIARALAQETKILLMDEPTSHLDLKHQRDLSSLFKQLNKEGMTIFCVMHDLNLTEHCCNKTALMRQGEIVAFGKTQDVLSAENLTQVFDVDFQPISSGVPIMRWN